MRVSDLTFGILAVVGTAFGQNTKRYCDPATLICYSSWTVTNGITFGVALPEAQAAPFDMLLQIVSPIKNGWVGFSWGGTMPYVPLTIGWINSAANTTIYSSRMAFGLSLPQAYDGAEYSYLKGTGYNTTHWSLNVRCRGCSQWHDVDGNLMSIDGAATAQKFAYGLATKAPAQPDSNRSTFNVHNSFGNYRFNLTQGWNANFAALVAANLVDIAPPTSSSALASTSTTIPTSISSVPATTSTATTQPIQTVIPASCNDVTKLAFPMSIAKGWRVTKVAGGLIQPRGLVFDTAGNLLVVQNGLGITAHKVGSNGCLISSKTIISQRNLNHGIVLSHDGKKLYASSATSVFAWDYDVQRMSVSGNSTAIVTGMDSSGHVTRTLVIPPKHPNLLIVSHGSNDNFDYGSADIKTGRSCVKVFNTSSIPESGYNYARGGYQMGYGLRNEVGLAFDGNGMLWGVENSSDELHRTINGTSVDIHTDNPADEINYLGDPSIENTNWYGYPTCYTCGAPDAITDRRFAVGDQFVLEPNATFSDDTCVESSVPARLALPAHSAPLDAKFDRNFTSMFITIHGSWNRSPSVGYKVVEVPFSKGSSGFGPKAPLNSTAGWQDVLWNPDVEHCSTTQCFRPVSIAQDVYGRMYITSDSGAEGEIVILGRG
ncbi:iron reductase domain protein [Plenodomus tracheiphilus IPT5]|uniref:Iron reductase domain protein n=1 Tax=Plenodomus tracheiphilus IPT5 TaxID=1408161 RepID=A0A6A7B196_9PLEO|nr:iron reductase domain protein [Plenodomus tracheiphilus IPT5]